MNRTSQTAPVLGDALRVVRRRLRLIVTIAPAVLLLAIYLAFALPAKFQSTATILLEPSSVPKEMIKTSVVSYSNQQIELVQGRVMTLDTLEELVKSYDPYPGTEASARRKARQVLEDTSIERVDPVTMEPLVESNAFSLHYDNPDPERAAEVASRLAQLFLTYNQRIRAEAAQQATQFLEQQSAAANAKMREIDAELARLKSQVGDAFPELQLRNQAAMERNERDLDALQQQILAAEAKESLLALQLSQLSPNLITQSGDLTDLATVRAKLAEAEQRYTADHPQVKRLRKAMETLLAQNEGSATRGSSGANNPQYMTTASQLASARKELANLRAQASRAREQMNQYADLIQRTPEVEKQYAEIQRRKGSVQAEYQQLFDKLQSAQLAQSFETEQRGERFTLLRAPSAARNPVSPNRVGLILLGFVLACGLAAASVAVAESVDSNVRHAGDLPELKGATLLASIPVIRNSQDVRRRRLLLGSYAAAYGLMLVLVGITVVSALR